MLRFENSGAEAKMTKCALVPRDGGCLRACLCDRKIMNAHSCACMCVSVHICFCDVSLSFTTTGHDLSVVDQSVRDILSVS